MPESARWLSCGRPEQPLLAADGSLLRVDLLVREPWGTLIIEYKSGQPDPEHARQVRRYLESLAGGHDRGEIRGLLIYLDLERFQLVTRESLSALVPDCAALLPPAGAPVSPVHDGGRP